MQFNVRNYTFTCWNFRATWQVLLINYTRIIPQNKGCINVEIFSKKDRIKAV